MPAPSELLRSLQSTLAALIEHYDEIDAVEEKARSAAAQLNATSMELSMASKRLEQVKAELAKAEDSLQSKRHLINDEAARALQDTNRQIAARQEELKVLEAQAATARAEHDNIVQGMSALAQRLRV